MGFEAYIYQEPKRILGVELVQLNMYHLTILDSLPLPFFDSSRKSADIGDLILILIVCSRPASEALNMLLAPVGIKRRFFNMLIARRAAASKVGLSEIADQVWDYLQDQFSCPPYYVESKQATRRPGTPFWQVVLMTLLSKTSLTEEQIMNRPVKRSFADYVTLCEAEGLLRVKSQEDVAFEQASAEFAKHNKFDPVSKQWINN